MNLDLAIALSVGMTAFVLLTLLLALIARLAIKTFTRVQGDDLDVRVANARAEELLCELLDSSELSQLKKSKYLDVASSWNPQRIYRIPLEDGMIRVYEGGKEIVRLCVQPTKTLPRYDVIAMHKLMIEGNELDYLLKANWFPPRSSEPGPRVPSRSTLI